MVYTIKVMLQLASSYQNKPILSLRNGQRIANVTELLINPNNLKIEGLFCLDNRKNRLILLAQDIRENNPAGFIINDHEVLSEIDDLVRLKPIIELRFSLKAKPVFGQSRSRLGKVDDFAIDSQSLYIQKLYVGQSLIKSFSGGQISVDRSQIIEITNKKIVIQEPLQGVKSGNLARATAN